MNSPWTKGPKFSPAAVSITGGSGVPVLLAQSFVAITAPAADTSEQTLATITVPANTLGANGALRITTYWTHTNSVNNKTLRIRYSGGAGTAFLNAAVTSTATSQIGTVIANRGATNSQVGGIFSTVTSTFGTSANTPITAAVDTTAATTVVIMCVKALGSETITLEGYSVEFVKPVA